MDLFLRHFSLCAAEPDCAWRLLADAIAARFLVRAGAAAVSQVHPRHVGNRPFATVGGHRNSGFADPFPLAQRAKTLEKKAKTLANACTCAIFRADSLPSGALCAPSATNFEELKQWRKKVAHRPNRKSSCRFPKIPVCPASRFPLCSTRSAHRSRKACAATGSSLSQASAR